MKLHLLGTTGYRPSEHRHTSCFMLPEQGVVLDAGTGMFRVRERIQTPYLDILLSHAHLDHVCGLTYLLYVLFEKPDVKARVYAEADKIESIQNHLLHQDLFPAPLSCEFIPIQFDRTATLSSGMEMTCFPLSHPGGSVGYRLTKDGCSMAYVTDTTASLEAHYLEKIRGVDLLVHECNFPDGREDWAELTGHSCATPVAKVAKSVGAGKLVLTHADPLSNDIDPIGMNTIREIFPNSILAEDKMVVEFPPSS